MSTFDQAMLIELTSQANTVFKLIF
jgi:hypothetical protein